MTSWRGLRSLVIAILLAAALVGAPANASRTTEPPPGWAVIPRSDTLVPNGVFAAVSCIDQFCMAVGSFFDELGGQAPMAASAKSEGWRVHPVPLSDIAGAGYLAAVSCTSPDACPTAGKASQMPAARALCLDEFGDQDGDPFQVASANE